MRSTSTGITASAARHEITIAAGMSVPKSRSPKKRVKPITPKPAPILAATKTTARPEVWSAAPTAATSSAVRARSSRRR